MGVLLFFLIFIYLFGAWDMSKFADTLHYANIVGTNKLGFMGGE